MVRIYYNLKAQAAEFVGREDVVEGEGEKRVKDDSKIFGLSNWKDRIAKNRD